MPKVSKELQIVAGRCLGLESTAFSRIRRDDISGKPSSRYGWGQASKALAMFLTFFTVGMGFARAASTPDSWQVSPGAKVVVDIDPSTIVRASLPAKMFGFNVNYRSFQMQLWNNRARAVKSPVIKDLLPFAGSAYRYPGGLVADSFDWKASLGPAAARKVQGSVIGGRPKPARFGLDEFLAFADMVDGQCWYVLNLVGWNPEHPTLEADPAVLAKHNADLVRYLKQKAAKFERGCHYELGNELDRNKFEWSADKYVQRALPTIQAILDVDPHARFVLPLRDFNWRYRQNSARGVSKASDFMAEMLRGLPMVTDYSLHQYYDGYRKNGKSRDLPFWLSRLEDSIADFRKLRPGQPPAVWITEHSRQSNSDKPGSDLTKFYTSNLGAAVSVADYLTALSQIPAVKGAFWHGLNAGPFQLFDYSARYRDLRPRPVYWALRLLSAMRADQVLMTRTQSTNRSHYKGGYDVRATAFRRVADQAIGLWIVNRADASMSAQVRYRPYAGRTVMLQHAYIAGRAGVDSDATDLDPKIQAEPVTERATFSRDGLLTLDLPPTSVSTFIVKSVSDIK